VESRIWIVGAACGENETSCQHPAARRLTEPFDSALRARGGKDLPAAMPLPGRRRSGSLIVSHDRLATPRRGSGSRSRPQAAKRWRVSATALTDCRWSGLFAPSGLARYLSKVERMALGSLRSLRSRAKPMAGRFLRRLLNLNPHNHNQRGRRRRLYLAVVEPSPLPRNPRAAALLAPTETAWRREPFCLYSGGGSPWNSVVNNMSVRDAKNAFEKMIGSCRGVPVLI